MVTKNKNTKKQKQSQDRSQKVEAFIARVGLTAMSVATVTSLVHMYEARGHQASATVHPAYAHTTEILEKGHDAMRRERDEIRHLSVSYGTSMRSHPTAGTI